ncbi:helix-turn-helix domain-containing protein [Serratia fonticola]|uniref:helix-turn-helix domain-containing protein n=1 Tax=Serratia fonticola TaxID=47917 RepID=UPI00301C074C
MSNKDFKMSENDRTVMQNTAANLAILMKEKGIDAAELSRSTGLGIATINSMRRGAGNPTISTLTALAKFFGVSLSELMEGDVEKERLPLRNVKAIPFVKIGDVDRFMESGIADDTYTTEIELARSESLFAILINNDSLYPQLSNGSVCIVSKDELPSDGDIVLVKIHQHIPCFRRVFIEGDSFLFTPIALEKSITPSIYCDYKIIGVVLKAIKKF